MVGTVVLGLLAGCGGGGSGETRSLDARQAEAVLPDSAAMPGWETVVKPVAYPLRKSQQFGFSRCFPVGARSSCTGARFLGFSSFQGRKGPDMTFQIQTYSDDSAARSAYGVVWKAWKQRVPEARNHSIENLGDECNAVLGLSGAGVQGTEGSVIVVREGSVLMMSMAESGTQFDMADSFLTRFAGAFAKRAEEAQAGRTPTAGVRG
ncbi:hypothetical protein ACGFT2_16330 [Streptomyces sp. NPDC048514]|uniref:hypothetical protein n=1 Tax=Streptomyces sp. NPDC048514 TaxID=3365564 RepID=UPI003710D14D